MRQYVVLRTLVLSPRLEYYTVGGMGTLWPEFFTLYGGVQFGSPFQSAARELAWNC